MSSLMVLRLARADALERMRRASFLVVLGAATWLGWLAYNGNIRMHLGRTRGVMNGPWAGTLMALTASLFVSMAGFYVVKNAIDRDRTTRVGEVLAATSVPTPVYLFAKWLSNFAVLASVVGVLAAAAAVLQRVQGSGMPFELWPLLAPFVFLALPALALVAALAVLFESVPWLAGGAGNVAFFFLWTLALSVPMASGVRWADWIGIAMVEDSLAASVRQQAPDAMGGMTFSAGPVVDSPDAVPITWRGVAWTPRIVVGRLAVGGVAILVALLPALWFDRFDPSRRTRRRDAASRAPATAVAASRWTGAGGLSPLTRDIAFGRLAGMVVAELRLAFKGVSRWWWLVAIGLALGSALAPRPAAGIVLAIAWIWPLLLWSPMGVRERIAGTEELLFSCPHAAIRQLAAVWIAGVTVAAVTGSGMGIRLVATGDAAGLAGWIAGAAFVPALAVALGVWSGSTRLFEALYTVWWYVGPMHAIPSLDFTGVAAMGRPPALSAVYLAAAAALLAVAAAGRRLRLARR